ncbi:MAG: PH domain-containing protein [Streptococcaceae bacterium]|jgi:hypothetical protein|nr:PH domain-containing protein [Streptococcaceae bacterium]
MIHSRQVLIEMIEKTGYLERDCAEKDLLILMNILDNDEQILNVTHAMNQAHYDTIFILLTNQRFLIVDANRPFAKQYDEYKLHKINSLTRIKHFLLCDLILELDNKTLKIDGVDKKSSKYIVPRFHEALENYEEGTWDNPFLKGIE